MLRHACSAIQVNISVQWLLTEVVAACHVCMEFNTGEHCSALAPRLQLQGAGTSDLQGRHMHIVVKHVVLLTQIGFKLISLCVINHALLSGTADLELSLMNYQLPPGLPADCSHQPAAIDTDFLVTQYVQLSFGYCCPLDTARQCVVLLR